MYIDLIVLVVLIVFVIIYSKRFQTYIFGFGMIDIVFRLLSILKEYIPLEQVKTFINEYVPGSIPSVINKYTTGMVNMAVTLIYVVIMFIFLYYVIRIFIKRKKF